MKVQSSLYVFLFFLHPPFLVDLHAHPNFPKSNTFTPQFAPSLVLIHALCRVLFVGAHVSIPLSAPPPCSAAFELLTSISSYQCGQQD